MLSGQRPIQIIYLIIIKYDYDYINYVYKKKKTLKGINKKKKIIFFVWVIKLPNSYNLNHEYFPLFHTIFVYRYIGNIKV